MARRSATVGRNSREYGENNQKNRTEKQRREMNAPMIRLWKRFIRLSCRGNPEAETERGMKAKGRRRMKAKKRRRMKAKERRRRRRSDSCVCKAIRVARDTRSAVDNGVVRTTISSMRRRKWVTMRDDRTNRRRNRNCVMARKG